MRFTPITSMMDYGPFDGKAAGEAIGGGLRKNKLASLMGSVQGAQTDDAREQAFQQLGAFDPESGKIARNEYATEQEELLDKVGKGARYLKSALASGDKAAAQGAWSAVRPYMSKIAMANGGTEPPADLSDDFVQTMMPNLEKVIAMTGGMEANRGTEGRVVGNALVDPYTGKVLYQGERQQNRQLVQDAEGNYYSVDPSDPGNATPVQIGGGSPVPQVGASNPQQAYRDAIAGIESAGSGDYSALGPVTKSGDRAYGRYQVMGANIPEWSQAALGRRLTPQEFLADADAQNAVFDHRFGGYAKKYGPEGAARAWFAGEGGMNKPGARDVLGTSVQGYEQKFVAGLGGRQLRGAGKASQSDGKASDWQVIQGQDGQFYRFNKLDGRVESAGVTGANAIRTADQQQKRAEAAAGIQGAIASTDQTIQQIDLLLRHPGRESGTGFSAKIPAIPGTDRKGFDAQLATFKAQTFIPMVSQLKGMGALSDAEGKKLTEAIGALDPEMPEAEFAASLNRIKTQLYRAQKLAYDKLGATRRNVGAPSPSPAPAPASSGGFRILD